MSWLRQLMGQSLQPGAGPAWWQTYKELPELPGSSLLSEVPFLVFDLETSGLEIKADQVLSIGAIVVQGACIQVRERLELLVRPARSGQGAAVPVHGLLDSRLQDGMPLRHALQEFVALAQNKVLVAHHAAFDLGMLNHQLHKRFGQKLHNPVIDTAHLARRFAPEANHGTATHYSLDQLAHDYGLTLHDRHTAPGDSFVTAQVLLYLLSRAEKRGITTLRELLKAPRAGLL